MKSVFLKLFLVLVLGIIAQKQLWAQESFAPEAPIIDGKNTDKIWQQASMHPISLKTQTSDGTISANYRLLWDYKSLYLLIEVADNELYHPKNDTTGDHLELYLDLDNSHSSEFDKKNDHLFYISFGSDSVTRHQNNPLWASYKNVTVKSMQKPDNDYTYEIALPWNNLINEGYFNPDVAVIGMELRIFDIDSKAKNVLTWNNMLQPFEWNKDVYVPSQFNVFPLRYGLISFQNPSTSNYSISSVTVKSIFNLGFTKSSTSADYTSNTANQYYLYSDYTSKAATVLQNKDFSLKVVPANPNSSCSMAAYVDWDQNGKFDYSEQIIIYPNVENQITVPSTAKIGTTRLRVYSSGYENVSGESGEVEDYSLNVISTAVGIGSISTESTACGTDKFPLTVQLVNYSGAPIKNASIEVNVTHASITKKYTRIYKSTLANNGQINFTVDSISTISPGAYLINAKIINYENSFGSSATIWTQENSQAFINYSTEFNSSESLNFWTANGFYWNSTAFAFYTSNDVTASLHSPKIKLLDASSELSFNYSALRTGDTLLVKYSTDCNKASTIDTISANNSTGTYTLNISNTLKKKNGSILNFHLEYLHGSGVYSGIRIENFSLKTFQNIGVFSVYTSSANCGNVKDTIFAVIKNYTDSTLPKGYGVVLQTRLSDGVLLDTVVKTVDKNLKPQSLDTVIMDIRNTVNSNEYQYMAYTTYPDNKPSDNKAYRTYTVAEPVSVPYFDNNYRYQTLSATQEEYMDLSNSITIIPNTKLYIEYSIEGTNENKEAIPSIGDSDTIFVEVSEDCGKHFSKTPFFIDSKTYNNTENAHRFLIANFKAYAGKTINIRLHATKQKTLGIAAWSLSVYSIQLITTPFQDISIRKVIHSGDNKLCGDQNDFVKVIIQNRGAEMPSNATVQVEARDEYGYSQSVSKPITISSKLEAFQYDTILVSGINTAKYSGNWVFKAYITASGDINHNNDTERVSKNYPREVTAPLTYDLTKSNKNILVLPEAQWTPYSNGIQGIANSVSDTILLITERIHGITADQYLSFSYKFDAGGSRDSLGAGDKIELLYSDQCNGNWTVDSVLNDSTKASASISSFRPVNIAAKKWVGKNGFFAFRLIRGTESSNSSLSIQINKIAIAKNNDIALTALRLNAATCGIVKDTAIAVIKNIGLSSVSNIPVVFKIQHNSDSIKQITLISKKTLRTGESDSLRFGYSSELAGFYAIDASIQFSGDLNNANNVIYATKTTVQATTQKDKELNWTENADGWHYYNSNVTLTDNYQSNTLQPGDSSWAQSPKFESIANDQLLIYSFKIASSSYSDRVNQLSVGDTVFVKYSIDCGASFKTLRVWNASTLSDNAEWHTDSIKLNFLAGQGVIFRVVAKSSQNTGRTSNSYTFALDYIRFYKPYSNIDIYDSYYKSNTCLSLIDSVFTIVTNTGSKALNGYTLSFNGKDTVIKQSLGVNQLDTVLCLSPTPTEGNYNYKITVSAEGTVDYSEINHYIYPKVSVPVWYENNWSTNSWLSDGFAIDDDGQNAVSYKKYSNASQQTLTSSTFKDIPANSYLVFDYKIQAVDYDGYLAKKIDSGDSILVQVIRNCNAKPETIGRINSKNAKISEALTSFPLSLAKYVNDDIIVRFLVKSAQLVSGDTIEYFTTTIDNFRIVNKTDIAVENIIRHKNTQCGDSRDKISVVIANKGAIDRSNFTIELDSYYQGSALDSSISIKYTKTLKPFTSDTVLIGYINTSIAGQYELSAHIPISDDTIANNNDKQLVFTVTTQTSLSEDFSTSPNDWEFKNTEIVAIGTNSLLKGRVAENDAWAITHSYGLVNASDSLLFDMSIENPKNQNILNKGNEVLVQISSNCGESFDTALVINTSNYIATPMQIALPLAKYAGKNIKIKFIGHRGKTAIQEPFAFLIDNVTIASRPPFTKVRLLRTYINNHSYLCGSPNDTLYADIRNYGNKIAENVIIKVEATGDIVRDTLFEVVVPKLDYDQAYQVALGVFDTQSETNYYFDVETKDDIISRVEDQYFTGYIGIPYSQTFDSKAKQSASGWDFSQMLQVNETISTGEMLSNTQISFTSPKFGIVSYSDALSFDFNITALDDSSKTIGAYLRKDDFVRIYISTDCGLSWKKLDSLNVYNQQMAASSRTFVKLLSEYTGQTVAFKFECSKGIVGRMSVAFDNLSISTKSDLAITSVSGNSSRHKACGNSNEPVYVTVANKGLVTAANYQLNVEVSHQTFRNATLTTVYKQVNVTIKDSLYRDSSKTFTIDNFDFSDTGDYYISANVQFLNDSNSSDNQRSSIISVLPFSKIPYSVNFSGESSTANNFKNLENHINNMYYSPNNTISSYRCVSSAIENGDSIVFITPVIAAINKYSRLNIAFDIKSSTLSNDDLGAYLHDKDSIIVSVSEDCMTSFKPIVTITRNNLFSYLTPYYQFEINKQLSDYENKNIIIKLEIKKGIIGNLQFELGKLEVSGIDLAVKAIKPTLSGCGGSDDNIMVYVVNESHSIISEVPLSIYANDRLVHSEVYKTVPLSKGDTAKINAIHYNLSAPFVSIRVIATNQSDENHQNDTLVWVKDIAKIKVPFTADLFTYWDTTNAHRTDTGKVVTSKLTNSKQHESRIVSPVITNIDDHTFLSFNMNVTNSVYKEIINDEYVYLLVTQNCGLSYDTLFVYDVTKRSSINFDVEVLTFDLKKYAGKEIKLEFVAAKGISTGVFEAQFSNISIFKTKFADIMQPTTPSTVLCAGSKTEHSTVYYNLADSTLIYNWRLLPTDAGQIVNNGNTVSIQWHSNYYGNAQIQVGIGSDVNQLRYSLPTAVTIDACIEDDKLETAQQVGVYPSPTTGILNIDLGKSIDAEYELSGIAGNVLLNGKLNKSIQLHIESIPAGTYNLVITTKKQKITKQIVKQ